MSPISRCGPEILEEAGVGDGRVLQEPGVFLFVDLVFGKTW